MYATASAPILVEARVLASVRVHMGLDRRMTMMLRARYPIAICLVLWIGGGCELSDSASTAGGYPDRESVEILNRFKNSVEIDGSDLFSCGRLLVVPTYLVVPTQLAPLLIDLGWRGSDYSEIADMTRFPPAHPFTLVFIDGQNIATINQIDDLHYKVVVNTESRANAFACLVGGSLTHKLFEDGRGWEVAVGKFDTIVPAAISPSDARRFGLEHRQVTKVPGGFIINRPFFINNTRRCQRRLVVSREFISEDGYYLFGVEKAIELDRGDTSLLSTKDWILDQSWTRFLIGASPLLDVTSQAIMGS